LAGRLRRLGAEFLAQNRFPILLASLFLAVGIGCGAWGATGIGPNEANYLNQYVETIFSHLRPDGTDILAGVKMAFEANGLVILGIYLCGLTVIGIPVIAGLLFVRGFALGFTAGFMIAQKGWPGILLAAAALLPQNLILAPVLVIASAVAACFATTLTRRIFNPQVALAAGFIRYTWSMTVMALAALAGGFVEVFITPELLAATLTLLNAR